jgi:hypothetical protein
MQRKSCFLKIFNVISVLLHVVVGVPPDFEVPLYRDHRRTELRIFGHLQPPRGGGGMMRSLNGCLRILSNNRERDSSTSTLSGYTFRVQGASSLVDNNEVVAISACFDVSDSVTDGVIIDGFDIGFGSHISQTTDSILYTKSPDTNRRLLIFNPTDPHRHAYEGIISYTETTRPSGLLLSRTSLVLPNGTVLATTAQYQPIAVAIHDSSDIIRVPDEIFVSLRQFLNANSAELRMRYGYYRVLRPNCFASLVDVLPSINIDLLMDSNHLLDETMVSTRLVLEPRDYLFPSLDHEDVCSFDIQPIAGGPSTDHQWSLNLFMLERIGGIHFDYQNNRIGFFDPM